MRESIERCVTQLENRSCEGDRADFYKHVEKLKIEEKRSFTSQNIKD